MGHKAYTNGIFIEVTAGTSIHDQDNRTIITPGTMSFHLKLDILLFRS